MLYEFKSRATGPLVMTQMVAERLLQIIGKKAGAQGIITAEQLPQAIAALEAAVAAEKAQAATRSAPPEPRAGNSPEEEAAAISLGQRAYPMLQMMRAAAAAQKDITWGV